MGFKKARRDARLSLREAGKLLGVSAQAISQWETGKTKPRADILPLVADLYGTTVDELLK